MENKSKEIQSMLDDAFKNRVIEDGSHEFCDRKCLLALEDICECKCGGINHGKGITLRHKLIHKAQKMGLNVGEDQSIASLTYLIDYWEKVAPGFKHARRSDACRRAWVSRKNLNFQSTLSYV